MTRSEELRAELQGRWEVALNGQTHLVTALNLGVLEMANWLCEKLAELESRLPPRQLSPEDPCGLPVHVRRP